jgi:hypothetical protein
MAGARMRKCPLCRHPQLLDPKALKQRNATWREAYGGWRRGHGQGARG